MDYRKRNKAIRKDHLPLLFIDQILGRLAEKDFFVSLMDIHTINRLP